MAANKFLSDIAVGSNKALNNLGSYDAALPFSRPAKYPLDRTGFFDTVTNALAYITNSNSKAYIGQELTVFDTTDINKAYKYFVSNTNTITKLLDERSISVTGASSFDSNVTFKAGIQIGSSGYSITTSGIPAGKLIGNGALPDAVLPTKFSGTSPIVTFSATTSSGNTVLTPKSISVDSKGRITGVTDGSSVTISAVDEKVEQKAIESGNYSIDFPLLFRKAAADSPNSIDGTLYSNAMVYKEESKEDGSTVGILSVHSINLTNGTTGITGTETTLNKSGLFFSNSKASNDDPKIGSSLSYFKDNEIYMNDTESTYGSGKTTIRSGSMVLESNSGNSKTTICSDSMVLESGSGETAISTTISSESVTTSNLKIGSATITYNSESKALVFTFE